MKTLYISDLDGTLLNPSAEISSYTAKNLNLLISDGLSFSVATARTEATVVPMLSEVNINNPVVLMNGAAVYDIQNKKYPLVNYIDKEAVKKTAFFAQNAGISGFCYIIENDKLETCYDNLSTEAMRGFYNERREKFNKKFTKITHLSDVCDRNVVYFCFMNTAEKLLPLLEELKNTSGVKTEYYRDIYDRNNYFLEVMSCNASKKQGTLFVKDYVKADRIVGFGDNLNDISLFEACDVSCAVKNANAEVKICADNIIESNAQDGVVKFIMSCK